MFMRSLGAMARSDRADEARKNATV